MGRVRILVVAITAILVVAAALLWTTEPSTESEAADVWGGRAFDGVIEVTLTLRSGRQRSKVLWVNGAGDEWHVYALAPAPEDGVQVDLYADHADVYLPVLHREAHVDASGLRGIGFLGSELSLADVVLLTTLPPDEIRDDAGGSVLEWVRDDGSLLGVELRDGELTIPGQEGSSVRVVPQVE